MAKRSRKEERMRIIGCLLLATIADLAAAQQQEFMCTGNSDPTEDIDCSLTRQIPSLTYDKDDGTTAAQCCVDIQGKCDGNTEVRAPYFMSRCGP